MSTDVARLVDTSHLIDRLSAAHLGHPGIAARVLFGEAASTIRTLNAKIEEQAAEIERLLEGKDKEWMFTKDIDRLQDAEASLLKAVEVLQSMKVAWESLGGNQYHSPKAVERWLWDDMKPVMDNLRAFLANMEKPNDK